MNYLQTAIFMLFLIGIFAISFYYIKHDDQTKSLLLIGLVLCVGFFIIAYSKFEAFNYMGARSARQSLIYLLFFINFGWIVSYCFQLFRSDFEYEKAIKGLSEYVEDKDKDLDIFLDNKLIMSISLKDGKQKIIVSKKWWSSNISVSKLTLKSTLNNLFGRVSLPRGLRNRGVEIKYIGVER